MFAKVVLILASLMNAINCFYVAGSFDEVQFSFVHGSTPYINSRYTMKNISSLINHERFDLNRQTVFYCHGLTDDSLTSESTLTVTRAYIKRNDHNIVILDWGQYSFTILANAVIRSSAIAERVAPLLIKLFHYGLDANKFHCVGHSIGAHICGIMGRKVITDSSGRLKFKRISALDAAYPFYYPAISGQPLSYRDAEFVDAIHTDTFFAGTPYRVGHADFYPNNGKLQSGCPDLHALDGINNLCSHHQAFRYWSESLVRRKVYPSKRCKNWKDFKNGRCDYNPTNYMGFDAIVGLQGVFFNDIIAKKDSASYRNFSPNIYEFVVTSFFERSDFAKLFKRLQRHFS